MPKPKQVLKNKIEIDPVEFSNKLSNFLDGVREKFGDDYIKKIRSFLYLRSRSAYLYILCVVILLSVLGKSIFHRIIPKIY